MKRRGVDRPQRRIGQRPRLPGHRAPRARDPAGRARRTAAPAGSSAAPSPSPRTYAAFARAMALHSCNRLPRMADDIPAVEGVEHRFVDANGIRIHVAEAGPADAPAAPMLLLHGWPEHWYMWRRVIGRPGRRVPPARSRPARLRLDRGAGPRLRRRDVRRRPGGAARRARARARIRRSATTGAAGPRCCSGSCTRIGSSGCWSATRRTRGRGSRPALALEAWRELVHVGDRDARARPPRPQQGWIARNILSRGNVGTPFTEEELDALRRELSGAASGATRSCSSIATTSGPFARACAGAGAMQRLTVPPCFCSASATATCRRGCSPATSRFADDMRVELVARLGPLHRRREAGPGDRTHTRLAHRRRG